MKIVSIVVLLIYIYGCSGRPHKKTGLEGKALPSFNLLLQDSITYFNTNSIPSGEPVVLYYFSPRCPYCRTQMEGIIEDMASLKNIQFFIFTTWPFAEMKGFYKHFELNKYPNIKVGFDYTNFFASYFKAEGVPYIAIYGKDKKLKETFMGKINVNQIKDVIQE